MSVQIIMNVNINKYTKKYTKAKMKGKTKYNKIIAISDQT